MTNELHNFEIGEKRSIKQSLLRGWRRKCPSCGSGPLMQDYLTVRDTCPVCSEELHHHRADDGPAWATILISGHLLAPLMLIVFEVFRPEGWVMAIGFSMMFLLLALYLLPRLKGMFVGLQWANRMHGFGGEGDQPLAHKRRYGTLDMSSRLGPYTTMDEAEKRRIIRDAATIVLLRVRDGKHQVLMGQRGSGAVFMPNKYVFPGGAVDKQDYDIVPTTPLSPIDEQRLSHLAPDGIASAIAMAAIRELWEETGLMIGKEGKADRDVPADWLGFYNQGLAPRADTLRFFFRAITPPGRPRRFDARFFIADSAAVHGSDEDFSDASDELGHLHWIDLEEAKALDLPFITEVVLSEVIAITRDPDAPRKTPFFHHDDERSHFTLF